MESSSMILSRIVLVLEAADRACSRAVFCQAACASEEKAEGLPKTYGR
jgi:hypothetical protein